VATADWNEFDRLFVGYDGLLWARRFDAKLQRIRNQTAPPGYRWDPWQQIGSEWDQLYWLKIFSDRDDESTQGFIYGVASNGDLLRNQCAGGQYPGSACSWQGWQRIGLGWDPAYWPQVFMGPQGLTYAVYSDGSLRRNRCSGGSYPDPSWTDPCTWGGWQVIGGNGWSQLTHVFIENDQEFPNVHSILVYAVWPDGSLQRNQCLRGSYPAISCTWQGWQVIGSGWSWFTDVFMDPATSDIYAKFPDGRLRAYRCNAAYGVPCNWTYSDL